MQFNQKLISNVNKTPIIYGFQNVFKILYKDNREKFTDYYFHPLFREIYKFHSKNLEYVKYSAEYLNNCPSQHKELFHERKPIYLIFDPDDQNDANEIYKITEINNKLNCDQIFAQYLNQASFKLNPVSYEKVLEFVFLLREKANTSGLELLRKKIDQMPSYRQSYNELNLTTKDFCQDFGADLVPEMANEFILYFVRGFNIRLKVIELIELTKNFCEWLFKNGFTKLKITSEVK